MFHRNVFEDFRNNPATGWLAPLSTVEHIGVPAMNGRAVVFPKPKRI
jgi:hypothetical protein